MPQEVQTRRRKLDARLAELAHDEPVLATDAVQRDHQQNLATRAEDFRTAISEGLENIGFLHAVRARPESYCRVSAPLTVPSLILPMSGVVRVNRQYLFRRDALLAGPLRDSGVACPLTTGDDDRLRD